MKRKPTSRSKFNFSGEARSTLLNRYAAEESYEEKVQNYDKEVAQDIKKPKNRKYLFLVIILVSVLVLIGIFVGIYLFLNSDARSARLISAKKSKEVYDTGIKNIPAPNEDSYLYMSKKGLSSTDIASINAKAFYVFSPELSKTFASKNPDKKYRVASITKLMTAYSALQTFEDDEDICILEETRLYGSIDLKKDDCFSLDDILTHMLVSSSNDAAKQIELNAAKKEVDFINLMNLSAESLQLSDTHYENVIGLDDVQNFSTARNSVQMLYALSQVTVPVETLGATNGRITAKNTGNSYEYKTTNILLNERSDIIAGKTGFTTEAGGTLVVIAKKPRWDFTIYAVILGTEDEETRFEEMSKLLDLVYARYRI